MPRLKKSILKPYPRALETPISIPRPPIESYLNGTTNPQDKNLKFVKDYREYQNVMFDQLMIKRMEKMKLLFDHYEIDTGNWYELAMKLAMDHVNGFSTQLEKAAGREKTWDAFLLAKLYFDITDFINENTRSHNTIAYACSKLALSDVWKKEYTSSANTLQQRYSLSKRSPFVMMYVDLYDSGNLNGALELKDFILKYYNNDEIKKIL